MRRTELDVVEPFRDDLRVELGRGRSGTAPTAASRRYTLRGDAGGHIEAESIWIHLDRDLRPLRLDDGFLEIYGESAARPARLDPPDAAARRTSRRHGSGRCA